MNPFDEPDLVEYSLHVEHIAGAYRVDVMELLDILEKRAMLLLRQAGQESTEERTADSVRGSFSEIQRLYNEIKQHVSA